MTPRESARLQSLNDLKQLPESANKAFAALGNAVNSKVVEKVVRALLAVQPQPVDRNTRHVVDAVAA